MQRRESPPLDAETLTRMLIEAGLIAPGEPWTISAASGGLNTAVFRAARPGGQPDLSIRVFDAPANLEREVEALAELASCPGVPEVRYAGAGILVHDYLPGNPAPLQDAGDAALERLCRCLACIHAARHAFYTLWPSPEIHHGSRRDLFRARCAGLAVSPELEGAGGPQVQRIAGWLGSRPLGEAGWSQATFSRLHGDLSYGNILWAGDSVGLIDWEFTRIGDPAEELAYLLTEQPVGDATAQRIRAAYESAGGGPDVWERVPEYAVFAALDSALWWIGYLLRRGEDPTGHAEVGARLAGAQRWVARVEARRG